MEIQIWEVINRERRRRRGINKNREFFMGLLGRLEDKIVRKKEEEGKGEGEI